MTSKLSACPYRGLQPYTEADEAYFFGRENDRELVLSNLYAASLTIFYGASGVGKSSVLLAGAVPQLRRTPRVAVVVFRDWQPGFEVALKEEVLRTVRPVARTEVTIDPRAPLDEFLLQTSRLLRGPVFFVLDQFEEYFLYHPASRAVDSFDAQFARAINRREVDAHFLLSMREDGLSSLDRFQARIPNLLSNMLRLEHLDRSAARDAIQKPLGVYNTRMRDNEMPFCIEDALVEILLDQALPGTLRAAQQHTDESAPTALQIAGIETPLLQLVLTRLWDDKRTWDSRNLSLSTFRELGEARGIASTHLDDVVTKHLTVGDREVAARVFHFLVTPSGAKIAHEAAALASWAELDEPAVRSVLTRLAGQHMRILRPVEAPGNAVRYEIFHDVLAPAIVDWRKRYIEEQTQRHAEESSRAEREELERRAEEQRQRAEAQERLAAEKAADARRFRRLAVLAGVVSVVASGTATWAACSQMQLGHERRAATAQASAAASARSLVVDANPERSVLLALHAVLATYSADRTVRPEAENALHRAIDALRLKNTLVVPEADLRGLALSADGKYLASAGGNATSTLWDARAGKDLRRLTEHTAAVNDAAFNRDGTRLATASSDGTTRVWITRSPTEKARVLRHDGAVWDVAFDPTSQRLVTASEDGVKLWDADLGKLLCTLHEGAEFSNVTFSFDGKWIAGASIEGIATVWDASRCKWLGQTIQHAGTSCQLDCQVTDVAFSADAALLATAGQDTTTKVWTLAPSKAPELRTTLHGHTNAVWSVAFSPDGKLATASPDRTVKIWDVNSGKELSTLAGHQGWVLDIAFSEDGRDLVTASQDGTIKIWDMSPTKELLTLAIPDVSTVDFSHDGTRFVTGSKKVTQVWDTQSGQCLQENSGGAAMFVPNGEQVVIVTETGDAKVWDLATSAVRPLSCQIPATPVWFDMSSEREVAVVDRDGNVTLCDEKSGRAKPFKSDVTRHVVSTAFSGDGRRLATAARDGTASIRNLTVGQEKHEIRLEKQFRDVTPFSTIVFSPDGVHVAAASWDHTARVWEAFSGERRVILSGHQAAVNDVVFSHDSKRLATAGEDGTARVWDAASGEELLTLHGHWGSVLDVDFNQTSTILATASTDGTVRLYALDIATLIDLARKRVIGKQLTEDDCRRYLRVERCPSQD